MSSTLVRHFFIFIADVTFHLFIFKMYYYLLIFDYAGFSLLQRVFLVVASGNHAAVAAQEPLIAEVSLAAELRLQGARASVLVARGLRSCSSWAPENKLSSCSTWSSCSTACGIFLDQGLTPCLLHWQADSLPLNHQGAPHFYMYNRVLFAVDLQKVIILQNWSSATLGFPWMWYSCTLLSQFFNQVYCIWGNWNAYVLAQFTLPH